MVAAVIFSSVAPFFLPRMAVAPLASPPVRPFGPRIMPFRPGFLFGPGPLGPRFPFIRLFGLTTCVWPLLIVGLIVLGTSLLARRPAPPTVIMPPPAAVPAVPVSLAVCSNCGQPLQPGWRHCPNCGQAIA